MTSVFQLVCELCRKCKGKCKKCCILVHWSLLLFTTQKFPHPNKQKETGFICSMSVRVLKLHFSFSFFLLLHSKCQSFDVWKGQTKHVFYAKPSHRISILQGECLPKKILPFKSICRSIRAGQYDQKCISQYFSKLYRFHGIWRYFFFPWMTGC